MKCHADCPRLPEGSPDRSRCERLYCQGFRPDSFHYDREVEEVRREQQEEGRRQSNNEVLSAAL